jgi:hypothetical protein
LGVVTFYHLFGLDIDRTPTANSGACIEFADQLLLFLEERVVQASTETVLIKAKGELRLF